jgi:chloramphenicol O-acetyltransferase
LNEFYKKHNIRVIDDNKRWARMRPYNYSFFNDPKNMDAMSTYTIAHDTEKLLTIEIPESDLKSIADFEDQVFNNIKTYGNHHYHMFNAMMEQKEAEKYLRETNAAVRKAYEHYSLMLALANGGRFNAGY